MNHLQDGFLKDFREIVLEHGLDLLFGLGGLAVRELDGTGTLAGPHRVIVQRQAFLILPDTESRTVFAIQYQQINTVWLGSRHTKLFTPFWPTEVHTKTI